jgi:SAM-dependent methyltransferase
MTMAAASTSSCAEQGDQPREIALPGMHEHVMKMVRAEHPDPRGVRVLDAGAGEGSLAARLHAGGYDVAACDLFPEMFRASGVECLKADAVDRLPYGDEEFDLVAVVEVIEHLDGHASFYRELNRVLKAGGTLLLTTPNMQSLKSRLRFLFTGYYYSFGPLDPAVCDPVRQHIMPMTIDRHRFMLAQCGFDLAAVKTDKWQTTSMMLAWLIPFVRIAARWSIGNGEGVRMQNSMDALCGRTLFMVARKRREKR